MILTQGSIPDQGNDPVSEVTTRTHTNRNRVKEDTLGDALIQRSRAIKEFNDLGPPDLVTLLKHVPSTKNSEVETYLYYTGLDNSSASAVAAHLNHVANVIGATPQSWFGKPKNFKVLRATHASFNAFSKADVIVNVNLPGTVSIESLNSFGERSEPDDQAWKEVFVSAVVRALITSENETDQVSAVVESRKLNPFQNIELAKLFFDYFEALFERGVFLGSAPEVQTPTLISNYLVDAFLRAVELTHLYEYALGILEKIKEREEQVVSLIVKVLLLKDEEIKAVQTLYNGIKANPRDAALLVIQSEFLVEKGEYDLALNSAIRAVNSSPSEFNTWSNLSKVYLKLDDIENSLLTLNACPMAGYKEKFQLKRVVSSKPDQLHLPLATDVNIEEIQAVNTKDVAAEHQRIDHALVNLQAANLKSTFAKAYDILTQIVLKIGWEALLKYRGKIFVMEDEYSNSQVSIPTNIGEKNEQSFKKKRLCERWLDNLFMLLYEDLKVYTTWQAEVIHFQAQKTQYVKPALEWEYLGITAFRLKHYKEAANAFKLSLGSRFSSNSTRYLLRYYEIETKELLKKQYKAQKKPSVNAQNGIGASTTSLDGLHLSPQQISKKLALLDERIIDSVVKLTAWNHRWYCEFSVFLLNALSKVIEREGLVKAQNQVRADYPDVTGASKLLNDSFDFLALYEVPGYDA